MFQQKHPVDCTISPTLKRHSPLINSILSDDEVMMVKARLLITILLSGDETLLVMVKELLLMIKSPCDDKVLFFIAKALFLNDKITLW